MDGANERRPIAERIADEALRSIVDEVWEKSRPIHEAQPPSSSLSDNGRRHVLEVEGRAGELADRSALDLTDVESCILSVAICCHDFGKSLPTEVLRSAYDDDHAKASAALLSPLAWFRDRLHPQHRLMVLNVIESHTFVPEDFLTATLRGSLRPSSAHDEEIRVPILASLLRLSDLTDATADRQQPLPENHEFRDERSYRTALFRAMTRAVVIKVSLIRVDVCYRNEAERQVAQQVKAYMEQQEFAPLRPLLQMLRLPDTLHVELIPEPGAAVHLDGGAAVYVPADAGRQEGRQADAVEEPHGQVVVRHLAGASRAVGVASVQAPSDGNTTMAQAYLVGSVPAAYWLVSSLGTAEWLIRLGAPLRSIAFGQDRLLLWGLYRSLARISGDSPDPVLATGLLDSLWDGPTQQHRWFALHLVAQAAWWRSPLGERITGTVAERDPGLVDFAAMSLADFARRRPGEADYALDHIILMRTETRATSTAGSRDLTWDTDISHIAEAAPAAVIRHAAQLAELDLQSDPNPYRVALELRDDDGIGYASTLVRLRNLLAKETSEPTAEGNDATARRAIAKLLRHREASVVTLGLSAISRSVEQCHDLAVQALSSPLTWQLDAHDVAEFILREVFPHCSDADRAGLEKTVLSIPLDEHPELGGWRRHYALTAIPHDFRSQRVRDETDLLEATYPGLATQEGGQLVPGPVVQAVDPAEGLPTLDDAIANPAMLRDAIARVIEHEGGAGPHAMYSVHIAVRGALARHPELLLPFVEQFGTMEKPLYDLVGPGVVDYLNTTTDQTTGNALLDIALALPGDPGPRFVDSLAYLFEKRWDSLAEERREELAALLMRWADEGAGAEEDDTSADRTFDTPNSLIEAGLRAPRGALVHAMIFVAFHLGAPADLLAAIQRVVEAGPLPIRAVALYALAPLLQRHYPEVVPIGVLALSQPTAALLPVAGKTLRVLQMPEVETVGFPLVRQFLDAEHDEVQRVIGLLTGLWAIRDDDPARGALLHEVLREAGPVAREMVGNVMATNTVGEDQAVMERARRWCAALLPTADAHTRVGMIQGWMQRGDVDLTPALLFIGQAAASADKEVVQQVGDWLGSTRREISDDVTQALVAAMLDTPLATGLLFSHYSLQAGNGFQTLHQRLVQCGRNDLALRLLDAAALHCVEPARALISQYQAEAPPQP